jgi:phosphoglycolate phosphatase-like HAD superfamily hydrolase
MKGTIVLDFDYTLADTAKFKEALASSDDADGVISRMPEFVFSGAHSVLQRLKTSGWRLALLTFGDPPFQKRKAARSGLLPYFDHALFTAEPKETRWPEFDVWPKPLIFINDNGAEIDALRSALPEARFIAVRGPKPPPRDPSIPVCADLEEVYRSVAGE